jgi:hypothetical protein
VDYLFIFQPRQGTCWKPSLSGICGSRNHSLFQKCWMSWKLTFLRTSSNRSSKKATLQVVHYKAIWDRAETLLQCKCPLKC